MHLDELFFKNKFGENVFSFIFILCQIRCHALLLVGLMCDVIAVLS